MELLQGSWFDSPALQRLAYLVLALSSVVYAQSPADPPSEPAAPPETAPETPPEAPATPPPVPPPPAPSVRAPEPEPEPAAPPTTSKTSVELEGFVQPQFRVRQDSPAQDDTNGFRFARVRPVLHAKTPLADGVEMNGFLEVELQPTFQMIDAFAGVTKKLADDGSIVVDLGQMRVPISRQQLLSDARISFVDKAQIATIAPRRDLGGRVTVVTPGPRAKVIAGVFDGEGANQIENINQKFLYAGRVEVTVLGAEGALAEGSFGKPYLTIAGSVGRNTLTNGDRLEAVTYVGGDIAGSYKGLYGTFEYLMVKHALTTSGDPATLPPDFAQNGWSAQLNYLLPLALPPAGRGQLEIGARLEEIDRNDTVPIVQPGDPEQSQRISTGVITYYVRKHSLKLQLALEHFQEIEDETVTGDSAIYDNDQAVLQLTYRMD